jgi:hypothetical protein
LEKHQNTVFIISYIESEILPIESEPAWELSWNLANLAKGSLQNLENLQATQSVPFYICSCPKPVSKIP